MTTRKFYRTIIQVEILSEEPLTGNETLAQVAHQITEGDWSGQVDTVMKEELNGREMTNLLIGQGSDPNFFNLTIDGNDLE